MEGLGWGRAPSRRPAHPRPTVHEAANWVVGRLRLAKTPRRVDVMWNRARASSARGEERAGADRPRAYTPAMRRWVCVLVLLFGFAGEGYAWTSRPRIPVPIERPLDPRDPMAGGLPMGAWWLPA
jgi:hypothetical protein